MNEFRVFLSASIFFLSCYLVFDLFYSGFNWAILVSAVAGFTLSHLIWPHQAKEQSTWYDLLEVVIELPFNLISNLIRAFRRMFKSSDGGIDVDF